MHFFNRIHVKYTIILVLNNSSSTMHEEHHQQRVWLPNTLFHDKCEVLPGAVWTVLVANAE